MASNLAADVVLLAVKGLRCWVSGAGLVLPKAFCVRLHRRMTPTAGPSPRVSAPFCMTIRCAPMGAPSAWAHAYVPLLLLVCWIHLCHQSQWASLPVCAARQEWCCLTRCSSQRVPRGGTCRALTHPAMCPAEPDDGWRDVGPAARLARRCQRELQNLVRQCTAAALQ